MVEPFKVLLMKFTRTHLLLIILLIYSIFTNTNAQEISSLHNSTLNKNSFNANKITPEFLLSAYNPPYAWRNGPYVDSDFVYYKNANFDNFLWAKDDDELMEKIHFYNFKFFLNIGDLFSEPDSNGVDYLRGVKVWNDGHETYNEPVAEIPEMLLRKIDTLVTKYKNDSLLIGYWLCDEPFPSAYGNIAKVISRIKQNDTLHFSLVNIGDNEYTTDENIEKFIDTTNIRVLSYDRYNFFNGFDLNEDYFQRLSMMRRIALRHNIPFYNIVQAVGTNGTSADFLDWRTPNNAEHRWLAYTSLTYGVHGLIWFHWDAEDWGVVQNPDREIIYPSLQNVNAEISILGKTMGKLQTVNVYHLNDNFNFDDSLDNKLILTIDNTPLIVGIFKDQTDSTNYFMLMNPNYSDSIETEVTINFELDSLKFYDITIGSWVNVPFENNKTSATFNFSLRKGSGKLFKFKKATQNGNGEISSEFILKQNYPNPFNRTTTIEYSIPNVVTKKFSPQQNVQIKIYDVLGREITTLVSDKQSPGNYFVRFNAINLPSGIYFYTLRAGNFVETKKMILLK